MNRKIIKYMIMAILYIVFIAELIVLIHTFEHYEKAQELANKNKAIEINESQIEEQGQTGNIEKVRERNDFYTAVSCVNKYLDYLYDKNEKAIYDCLDQSYIEKKEISLNNVLRMTEKIDSKTSFDAKKMYEQELPNKIIQYYAYGKLKKENSQEDSAEGKDFYISIKIDKAKGTFTLLPDTYIN